MAWLLLIPLFLLSGSTLAQQSPGQWPGAAMSGAAPPPAAVPERAIHHADLLPHLEEIRQHYPQLYQRLRRAIGPDIEAVAATAPARRRSTPVDVLLRQQGRGKAAGGQNLPSHLVGKG